MVRTPCRSTVAKQSVPNTFRRKVKTWCGCYVSLGSTKANPKAPRPRQNLTHENTGASLSLSQRIERAYQTPVCTLTASSLCAVKKGFCDSTLRERICLLPNPLLSNAIEKHQYKRKKACDISFSLCNEIATEERQSQCFSAAVCCSTKLG